MPSAVATSASAMPVETEPRPPCPRDAHRVEGGHDPDDGAEEADERRRRPDRREHAEPLPRVDARSDDDPARGAIVGFEPDRALGRVADDARHLADEVGDVAARERSRRGGRADHPLLGQRAGARAARNSADSRPDRVSFSTRSTATASETSDIATRRIITAFASGPIAGQSSIK